MANQIKCGERENSLPIGKGEREDTLPTGREEKEDTQPIDKAEREDTIFVGKGERENTLPIDKGYAWIIVLAGTGIFLQGAGGYKNQGILLVETMEKFEGIYSPSEILWVFTATSIIGCALCPLTGYMTVKLTARPVIMMGIVSIALSHIGLAYAYNLPTMIVFYSLPAGFGYFTTVIISIQVSGPYFDKKKALAMGITAGGGGGMGSIVIPNVLRLLFDEMDYSGALLLYAGINLQFLCLAALLRPMSYYENRYSDQTSKVSKYCTESTLVSEDLYRSHTTITAEPEKRRRSATFTSSSSDISTVTALNLDREYHSTSKLDNLSTSSKQKTTPVISANSSESKFSIQDYETTAGKRNAMREKIDCRILLIPKFLLACGSIMLMSLGIAVFFSCVPALGKETGVSKDTVALAITLTAVLEIPGRIGNGFVADRNIISPTAQLALCEFGAGFLILLGAIFSSLPGIILGLIGMATVGTSVISIFPTVITELIGQEHVINGMGIQQGFQTISVVISSFIAAFIYDTTGSWRYVFFYIAGTSMSASVVLWPYLIVRYFRRRFKGSKSVETSKQ